MKSGEVVTFKIRNNKTYVNAKDIKSKVVKCKVIKVYKHFILVQRGLIRECFLKADFLTNDIQVLKTGGVK